MADNEAPSKTVLLERRDELSLVSEGKSVLEERRDILAQAIMNELRDVERRFAVLKQQQGRAMASLRNAALRHGPQGLRRLALKQSKIPDSDWKRRNYFGTCLVSVQLPTMTAPEEVRWDSTEEVALARLRFFQFLTAILEVAARLNNLKRLTREFRRSQRRVNALEYVVMPELVTSIQNIEFALEEMERENMVRALNMKRQMTLDE